MQAMTRLAQSSAMPTARNARPRRANPRLLKRLLMPG